MANKKDDDTFQSLIIGGIIGAALGALLSKNNKGEFSAIGAIAGAAIMASAKAREDAQKTSIPLIQEENDALYEVYADGTRKLIKRLPKQGKHLPKNFTLK